MCSAKAPHLGAIPLFVKRGVHNFLCTVACLLVCKQTLTVTLEGEKLAALPVGTHGRATFVAAMSLGPEATVLPASRGDTTELTVLHHRCADPVDARIVANNFVGWIHHHDLKVLESGVLVHPVRVEHTEVATLASSALLSHTTQRAASLQVVDRRCAAFRTLDPCGQGACGLHDGCAHGRCRNPAWPCIRDGAPCLGEWGESHGRWSAIA